KPYENTDACWHLLSDAGKLARYLGLVAPDAFVDQRNPDPHVFAQPASGVAVGWSVGELPSWSLPAIRADLADCLDLELSDCYVEGYDHSLGDQPYLLELWIEKTTQNDVLVPLCRHHGINLVTAAGFLSITAAVNLLKRIAETGKPARVFYISDF